MRPELFELVLVVWAVKINDFLSGQYCLHGALAQHLHVYAAGASTPANARIFLSTRLWIFIEFVFGILLLRERFIVKVRSSPFSSENFERFPQTTCVTMAVWPKWRKRVLKVTEEGPLWDATYFTLEVGSEKSFMRFYIIHAQPAQSFACLTGRVSRLFVCKQSRSICSMRVFRQWHSCTCARSAATRATASFASTKGAASDYDWVRSGHVPAKPNRCAVL